MSTSILHTIVGTVTGRVVGGIVGLAVIGAGIALWRMDPANWEALKQGTGSVLTVIGKILGWILGVGLLPWATFFLSTAAERMKHNAAGVALVIVYTALGATALLWLFDWRLQGATAWVFFVAAVLLALVYNVLICDWIADRMSA